MKRLTLTISLILVLVILVGCMSNKYKIGEKSFNSSSEALQRYAEIYSNIIKEIYPSKNPVEGTALIIIPSDVEIQKNYMTYGGSTPQESIDFITACVRIKYQFIANAIAKRRIFDSVSVARHNGNPASYPIGGSDFIIFADVDGLFIKEKNKTLIIPLTFDKNKPEGLPRNEAFLDELNQQAQNLRAK
jgi:hypothetical protein